MSVKAPSKSAFSTARAARVGVRAFRGNLAKYLKEAKAGRPIIVQERGRSAYVLLKFEEAPMPAFGCMRERTEYSAGAVVNADEPWPPGKMP